jgi:PhzF family phenazine biosynthesis protein
MAGVRRFIQCDVFTTVPTKGNGLAVVVDGDGLSEEAMRSFAAWTNLAETTFLMTPTDTGADYKVRIFTPSREMLFAGHPTLGSCAAWLHCGGRPRQAGRVVQECGVGLVTIDMSGPQPAFAAPKTTVEPMAPAMHAAIVEALGLNPETIVRTAQLSNGPTWQVFELKGAADVLAVDGKRVRYPQFVGIGLIGAQPAGAETDYEVRMLAPSSGMLEDPITGSLNAAIARWMYESGRWRAPVMVAQGTTINRVGRVAIRHEAATDTTWIGGNTCLLIEGTVQL